MDLEAIPGVGAKTAEALHELDDPVATVESGDVAAIARAPGVNEARAVRIARGAIRRRHDDHDRLLATDRAREVYRDAVGLLTDRTVTEYAAKRMETFYPSASPSRIAEAQSVVETALTRDPDPDILEALEGVEPLTDPATVRVRDRCLATEDGETYARAEEAMPELSVETVSDARDIAELARAYASVIVLDESFAGMDLDDNVSVRPDALETPAETVPERLLAFFAANRVRLLAAAEVYEMVELHEGASATVGAVGSGADTGETVAADTGETVAADAGEMVTAETGETTAAHTPPVDPDRLREALDRVDEDGTIVDDVELTRLTAAVDDLDTAVSTAESVADDHLRTAIRERDVTIEGTDFLSLVEQGARVDSLLDRELADEYDTALERAREHLVDALQLEPDEADLARLVFGGTPTFPATHDEAAASRLRTELAAARDRRAARLKADLASELDALRGPVETLVRDALELDVELAIARFARDFECTMPVVTEPDQDVDGETGRRGFRIIGGRSPLLDVPFEAVDPVDYEVSGVTLLSGVNSGGKTSTIDLVALIVILAQMGLPVPATAVELERFTELHYYAKSQGTLDAGAFEATLMDFGDLVDGASGRLVLVDELESITEPGASATIIAGILEALAEQDATAVFVSHLAREIREAASTDVAVDGIEAIGLVDGELRVTRSPQKNHLARSTPELIVEKLANERGGGFYTDLLEKF